MSSYREISQCRICGNKNLEPVLNLGTQVLTGVFPKDRHQSISEGPLELVKCVEDSSDQACGLLQLRYSFNPDEMYRQEYGYRSGLNQTMTRHLQSIVKRICSLVKLFPGDIALDIGSNDSTLLKSYPEKGLMLIGIDPSAEQFRQYYPDAAHLVVDFFSASAYRSVSGGKKAKVVTSIAMFYDLPSPWEFMQNIKEILAEDGVWVLEQSYMPTMLDQLAYDTVCHEHLEYYGLRQIQWMAQRTGLKIVDVERNEINGGSIQIVIMHEQSTYQQQSKLVTTLLDQEKSSGLTTLEPYYEFRDKVYRHRDELIKRVRDINSQGQVILGYGASTKGNVILQFCAFTEQDISAIAERNPNKYGRFTPGTHIPIISEAEARSRRPDYFLVLPWHFREEFTQREKEFLDQGGKFLFPLPHIEEVGP